MDGVQDALETMALGDDDPRLNKITSETERQLDDAVSNLGACMSCNWTPDTVFSDIRTLKSSPPPSKVNFAPAFPTNGLCTWLFRSL